jgi:hypothetical protein
MGDWRTLHLFDKTKYIKEIIPQVRNLDTYLPVFLNEKHSRWLKGFSIPTEEIIKDTIGLTSELDEELSCHPELVKLNQITNKNYDNYYSNRENFIRQRQASIEFFEYLIIETIFSSVADFNPHFILGKRMFEGILDAKNNSIAEELTSKITSQNESSILDVIDGGIINWLSAEEVHLLYMDRENIIPLDEEGIDYVDEFKEFLKYASERNLGLISLRNPRESDLTRLQRNENELMQMTKSLKFKNIIISAQ